MNCRLAFALSPLVLRLDRKIAILAACENAAPRPGAGRFADFQDDSLELDPVMRRERGIACQRAKSPNRTVPDLLAPRFCVRLPARLRRSGRPGSHPGLLCYAA